MMYNYGFISFKNSTPNKWALPFILLIFILPFFYFVLFGQYTLTPFSFENLNGYVSGFLSSYYIPSYKHSFVWFAVFLVILSSLYFLDLDKNKISFLFFLIYLLPLSPLVFSSKGAIFSLLLLPLIKTPYKYILFVICFFFTSIIVFHFLDPELDSFRKNMWLTSLNSLLETPFGIGPGVSVFFLHDNCDISFPPVHLTLMCENNLYGFESSFFLFLFEYGFLGLPVFILFTIAPFFIGISGKNIFITSVVLYSRALSFGSFVGNHVLLPWHIVSLSVIFMLFGYLYANRFSSNSCFYTP